MNQGIQDESRCRPQSKPPEAIGRMTPKTSRWPEKTKHQCAGDDDHHLRKESRIGMEVDLNGRPLLTNIEMGSCAGEPIRWIEPKRVGPLHRCSELQDDGLA